MDLIRLDQFTQLNDDDDTRIHLWKFNWQNWDIDTEGFLSGTTVPTEPYFNICNLAEMKSDTDVFSFLLSADWFALCLVIQPEGVERFFSGRSTNCCLWKVTVYKWKQTDISQVAKKNNRRWHSVKKTLYGHSPWLTTLMLIAHETLTVFQSTSLFTSFVWLVSGRFGVLINLCAHDQLWRGVLLLSEWQLRLIVMANINEQCAGSFNATALYPAGFPWYRVSSTTRV